MGIWSSAAAPLSLMIVSLAANSEKSRFRVIVWPSRKSSTVPPVLVCTCTSSPFASPVDSPANLAGSIPIAASSKMHRSTSASVELDGA